MIDKNMELFLKLEDTYKTLLSSEKVLAMAISVNMIDSYDDIWFKNLLRAKGDLNVAVNKLDLLLKKENSVLNVLKKLNQSAHFLRESSHKTDGN